MSSTPATSPAVVPSRRARPPRPSWPTSTCRCSWQSDPIRRLALLATLVALTGCAGSTAAAVVTTTTTSPATTTTTTAAPGPPSFASSVAPVTAAGLGRSWRPGCPVEPALLRRIHLRHWGFDDQAHDGELVVRVDVVDVTIATFRRLYDGHVPIRRMRAIEAYGGDDAASMADDNTSAFNCRAVAGTSRWSEHADGTAIDVNPVENPYLRPGHVDPPAGAAFADRGDIRPGMAVAGGPLVAAFDAVGWGWGGRWASPDLQHFSASGR